MRLLLMFVELAVLVFGSWTLGYHFALLVGLQAGLTIVPFLAILLPLLILSWRNWKSALYCVKRERWFLLGTALISLSAGTSTLFILKPTPDDYCFFHRALVQLQHPDKPFFLTDTGHNVAGLPPLSILHVSTSYEPFVATMASLFRADALNAYQNGGAFLGGVLLAVVLILLYRRFRLRPATALAATVCAFIFLLIDVRFDNRSFGHVVLFIWIGRVMLWIVILPLTLLFAHRFLTRPTWRKFLLMALTCVCAVGLSGSGVFMIPVFVLGISLSYVFSYGCGRNRWKRAVMLNVACFYGAGVAALLLCGVLPRPADVSAWRDFWQGTWWENLALVFGQPSILFRDAMVLLVLPIICLLRPLNRLIAMLTVVLCLIFANPLLGPLWLKAILPASYWRLYFLFPVPWCAGLVVNSIFGHERSKLRLASHRVLAAVVVLAILNSYRFSTMIPGRIADRAGLKAPWEYRFPRPELAFARSVSNRLHGRSLLAPEGVAVVLGLINPDIRFEAPRGSVHQFVNAGRKEEGLRRQAAKRLCTTGRRSPEADAALLRSLETGVDAVILREFEPATQASMAELFRRGCGQWVEVERNNGYVLLLREDSLR